MFLKYDIRTAKNRQKEKQLDFKKKNCVSKYTVVLSSAAHILKNWNDIEKISMATAQGWHPNSWSVPYFYRQAKAERIQHHQTISSTNAKGSPLDRKHRKVV